MASAVPSRPIPALYTVYILRSTVRHASLYIGSTTDPPRRLKQHNGALQGGAARTARASLRPWEMVGLVSGFPGAVAALQFEWALTNPHLSLHIPAGARLSVARQTKKNGHPRRPPASMHSVLANLHLLLTVPSFARWPLRLHVFAPEVHAAWTAWVAQQQQQQQQQQVSGVAGPIDVVTDFGPAGEGAAAEPGPPWGVHALPLDYGPLRDYVDKARDIFLFERAGGCAVCRAALPAGAGLYAVCPNAGCEAVGHLRCWSGHLLGQEAAAAAAQPAGGSGGSSGGGAGGDHLVPLRGRCPTCGGPVVWGDMMKELTLRLRAPGAVEKLVRAPRRLAKASAADQAAAKAPTAPVRAKTTARGAGAAADGPATKRTTTARGTTAAAAAATPAAPTAAPPSGTQPAEAGRAVSPAVIVL